MYMYVHVHVFLLWRLFRFISVHALITKQNIHMRHVMLLMKSATLNPGSRRQHRHHIAIAAAASPLGSTRVIPGCRADHRNSESQRGR